MSAVGSILGLGGGASGTGFNGPSQANLVTAATADQANQLYNTNQQALNSQSGFAQAAGASGLQGLQNQNQVYSQLQGVANGTGPNPAQAMLNQSTGQNVANQAALMAGQRGADQNVGLIARQAAQQGAATQQQAVGQAATQQANQSLNAINSMGNLASQQVNQGSNAVSAYSGAAQGEQSNVLNAIGQLNSANAGVQSSINTANASMANTRLGQQGNVIGNVMGGIGSALGMARGGMIPQPMAAGGLPQAGQYMPLDPNSPDPFDSTKPASIQSSPADKMSGAATKGPRSNIGKSFAQTNQNQPQSQPDGLSQSGQMIGKAIGNGVKALFSSSAPASTDASGYNQYAASGFSPEQMSNESSRQAAIQAGGIPAPSPVDQDQGNPQTQMQAANDAPVMAAHGGKIPLLLSPGEKKLTPQQAKKVAAGGKVEGETVPGKAPVKGAKDSYANDIVKDEADPGTIILPRSVTQAKHPHWEAHKFVSAIMAKQGKLPAKKSK